MYKTTGVVGSKRTGLSADLPDATRSGYPHTSCTMLHVLMPSVGLEMHALQGHLTNPAYVMWADPPTLRVDAQVLHS